jgi:hypothetical protein
MSRPRKFDHAECRRLYDTGGWTQSGLAAHYGVHQAAIWYALYPDRAREKARRQKAQERDRSVQDRYRERNRDAITAYHREWYRKNRRASLLAQKCRIPIAQARAWLSDGGAQ